MARKKPVFIPDVLDRILRKQRVSDEDLHAVAAGAAQLRKEWLRSVNEALGFLQGGTPEFTAFKNCIQSVGSLLGQAGIVSAQEMQDLWVEIEMRER